MLRIMQDDREDSHIKTAAIASKELSSIENDDLLRASAVDAQRANTEEHETSLIQALRSQPWALFWSLIVSLSVIMEGYDTLLINNFFGLPGFQEKFGVYVSQAAGYQIPGRWQVALGTGLTAGAIVGAFLNGLAIPRFGFRICFFVALVLMIGFVFLSFFGTTIEVQTIGQVLCGLPWGAFSTLGPAYASEVCPLAFRPYLTAYMNMCFAIGQLIGAGVIQGVVRRTDSLSYKLPYGIQWVWPVPLLLAAYLMPESPWWLVRHGRFKDAEHSVARLSSESYKVRSRQRVALMIHTNITEQKITKGSSYLDCFKGTERRRTEIACMSFAGQILCGIQLAFFPTYFFEQAGISSNNAYKLGLGATALNFVGTIISWLLMARFGRRPMYLCGMAAMSVCLLLIGVLAIPHSSALPWVQAALCLVWLFSFATSVGPIGWTIPAEVSSTRLRSQTVVLARNSYYLAQLFATIIEPYMVNPSEWNWKGKTGFFWLGFSSLTLLWAYFRLPETKGRTFEELDIMFAEDVPTRAFKSYEVAIV